MKDGEAIGEAIIALMSQLLENQSTIRMVFAAAPSQNEMPIDIVCLGIGENGHITFNDPPSRQFPRSRHRQTRRTGFGLSHTTGSRGCET